MILVEIRASWASLPFGLPSSASATAKTSEKYRARVSGGGLESFTAFTDVWNATQPGDRKDNLENMELVGG